MNAAGIGNSTAPRAWRIIAHDRLASTNDEARRLAQEGAAAGAIVWAREQFAGRGRRGRSWTPVPGNLYASLLLRPDCAPAVAAQITFLAALAVGEAVLEPLPAAPLAYKWPNDVLLGGRKIAGILCESAIAASGSIDWVVVGIGLNLAGHPPGTETPATSLDGAGSPGIAPEAMLERIADRFFSWFGRWQREGFGPVRAAWLGRAHGLGGPILVRLGREETSGRFGGLDPEGALLLASDAGTRRITAGEVFPALG